MNLKAINTIQPRKTFMTSVMYRYYLARIINNTKCTERLMTEYKTHTDILSRTEIINDVTCMNMIIRIPKVQYITFLPSKIERSLTHVNNKPTKITNHAYIQ